MTKVKSKKQHQKHKRSLKSRKSQRGGVFPQNFPVVYLLVGTHLILCSKKVYLLDKKNHFLLEIDILLEEEQLVIYIKAV